MAPPRVTVLVQVSGSGTLIHAATRAMRVVLGSWNLSSPRLSGNVTLKAWKLSGTLQPFFLIYCCCLHCCLRRHPSLPSLSHRMSSLC